MRTINSPGVQITEKDLSLRINNPVGTIIFVPGFASQGPISEPIQITSASELEAIFGTPTNAAERYFYYSCREVLNSPGQLLAARLPYGAEAGTTHTTKFYSALFYPVAYSNSVEQLNFSQDVVPEWVIGQPVHKTLTYNEYHALLNNNFTWKATTTNPTKIYAIKDPVSNRLVYFNDQGTDISEYSVVQDKAKNWPDQQKDQEALIANKTVCLFTEEDFAAIKETTYADLFNFPLSGSNVPEDEFIVEFNNSPGTPTFTVIETQDQAPEYEVEAGFIILNDIQSATNELAEGYYIGFADNMSQYLESPQFDSIKSVTTIIDTLGNRADIPQARLEFALSATVLESDKGVTSVSETLEKVGFQGFGTELYQDHLSLGVYRIRRSTVDPTKLALAPVERYLGSFDANRKQVNQAGGLPQTAYLENLINTDSPNIRIQINPAISNQYEWTAANSGVEPKARITVHPEAKKLTTIGVYVPDTRTIEETKVIGNVTLKLDKLFRAIESPENILLDVVADAGLSTIFAASYKQNQTISSDLNPKTVGAISSYNDEAYAPITPFYQESWLSVALQFVNFAENTRKDCVALIDPPRSLFVSGRDSKVLDLPDKNFTEDVYNPLKRLASLETNYGAMYGNWIKINDVYSGRRFWTPASGFAAAIFARSDAATQPWFAPAGLNRGTFNAIDIAFNPNQKQRDRLYEISVNPICFFNGDGHVVMGQKTLQIKPTAFDRLNVRRLFLTLERQVGQAVKYFVFEPNTAATRLRLVNTISPLFDFAKRNQGVYDYMIVCDERNNTPQTIDNNELIVDIYIKPVRAAEFILINFIATRTGQDFAELI